jgi:hypothetical protein
MAFGGYSRYGGFDRGAERGRALAYKHREKPKRTVFETAMVAHVWAQQNQPYGRNAKATVYFDGPTIYSYGNHFPMASFAKPDVVLVTTDRASVTTSSHISAVRGALRNVSGRRIYDVANVLARTPAEHQANLDAMLRSIERNVLAMRNTRYGATRRRSAAKSIPLAVEEANAYQREFFPRRRKPAATVPADVVTNIRAADVAKAKRAFVDARAAFMGDTCSRLDRVKWQARSLINAAVNYRNACRVAGEADPVTDVNVMRVLKLYFGARRLLAKGIIPPQRYSYHHGRKHSIVTAQGRIYSDQRPILLTPRLFSQPVGYADFDRFARDMKTTAQLEAEAAERAERAAAWEAERKAAEAARTKELAEVIAEWRAGALPSISRLRSAPCMLRVKGTEIETSWGARFPAEHARKAWRAISAVYRAGVTWQTNGHKIPLGHFQVDRIEADGTLHAGCHTLSRAEIEHCAALLGLPSVAEMES